MFPKSRTFFLKICFSVGKRRSIVSTVNIVSIASIAANIASDVAEPRRAAALLTNFRLRSTESADAVTRKRKRRAPRRQSPSPSHWNPGGDGGARSPPLRLAFPRQVAAQLATRLSRRRGKRRRGGGRRRWCGTYRSRRSS